MLPEIRTRADELLAGRTDAEVRADLRAGRLVRLRAGTYAEAGGFADLSAADRHHLRSVAEARACPGLVVSHHSAAILHGLPLVDDRLASVSLTRPGRGGSSRTAFRTVHAAALRDEDVVVVHGVPVTSIARTLVDLARSGNDRGAVVAADAALHSGAVSAGAVTEEFARSVRFRGHARAGRVLRLVDGRAESPGETCFRLAVAPSFPTLELQITVLDEDGLFRGRSDGGLLEHGLLLEFDGRTKYAGLLRPGQSVIDVVLAEKRREEGFAELGWATFRTVWSDLRDPVGLCGRLRRRCASRTAFTIRGSRQPAPALRVPI